MLRSPPAASRHDLHRLGNPGIWLDICAENRPAILTALDGSCATGEMRTAVADGDRTGLHDRLQRPAKHQPADPATGLSSWPSCASRSWTGPAPVPACSPSPSWGQHRQPRQHSVEGNRCRCRARRRANAELYRGGLMARIPPGSNGSPDGPAGGEAGGRRTPRSVPGLKSIANRALVCAALADGRLAAQRAAGDDTALLDCPASTSTAPEPSSSSTAAAGRRPGRARSRPGLRTTSFRHGVALGGTARADGLAAGPADTRCTMRSRWRRVPRSASRSPARRDPWPAARWRCRCPAMSAPVRHCPGCSSPRRRRADDRADSGCVPPVHRDDRRVMQHFGIAGVDVGGRGVDAAATRDGADVEPDASSPATCHAAVWPRWVTVPGRGVVDPGDAAFAGILR